MEILNEIRHFIRGRNLLAHIGIWFIAAILLTVASTVFKNQLIGIIYLAIFLAFLLTFQTSYCLWARTIKIYCLILIIYSTSVGTIIFAYILYPNVFKDLLSEKVLHDIGIIERGKDVASLTSCIIALIITLLSIIYLVIFHDDFHRFLYLAIEDDISLSTPLTGSQLGVQSISINDSTFIRLSSNNVSPEPNIHQEVIETTVIDGNLPALQPIDNASNEKQDKTDSLSDKQYWIQLVKNLFECIWRIIESHYFKVVAFMIFRLAVVDIGLLNAPFLFIVIVALSLPSIEYGCCVAASWLISFIVINRNLYHLEGHLIPYPLDVAPNCTKLPDVRFFNKTWAHYLGLNDFVDPPDPNQPNQVSDIHNTINSGEHLIVILMITFLSFISIHRTRRVDKEYERSFGVIFSGIGRREADASIMNAFKYLCNFGFYQFGVEITCMTLVIAITNRLDVVAALYGVILLLISIITSRNTLAKIWLPIKTLISFAILMQYFLILGLPEPLCAKYPWTSLPEPIKDWLFLPMYGLRSEQIENRSLLMLFDFLVILAVSRQSLVFIYTAPNYVQSRRSEDAHFRNRYLPIRSELVIEDYFNQPTTPIKFLKMTFFVSFYWITLTVVLVAGATKISLFSLGYLIGCFAFLWYGNDAYLLPVRRLICGWNIFILYSCLVIITKVFLQLITCQFTGYFNNNCRYLEILHVVCYKSLENNNELNDKCKLPSKDELDIAWDGLCLFFLLMQRVVFDSRYFKFLIMEVKAQHILASRGAELILATQVEEAKAQAKYEDKMMKSVRQKMEDLKTEGEETSKAWQRLLNLPHHHQIIRNADRHLFSTKLDDTVSECSLDDSKYRKDFIPDPLGDELERLDEKLGISAVFTRWMKGENPFIDVEITQTRIRLSRSPPTGASRSPVGEFSSAGSENDLMLVRPLGSSASNSSNLNVDQSGDNIQGPSTATESIQPEATRPTSSLGQHIPVLSSPESFDLLSETEGQPDIKRRNLLWLLNNISFSFLLSATVKLNKLSRSYRYVSRRMDADKDVLKKSHYDLNDERFKKDQQWRNNVINSLSQTYTRNNPDRTNLKLNMFTQFCRALGYVVVSNTSLWCQIIIIVNQVYSTSLLSLPLALLTLLWGTLSVPRPTKRFWKTIITITEAVIVIKYVCQFPSWKFNPNDNPYSVTNLLGINDMTGGSTIVIDLILLLALFFHRSRLKSLGQWNATTEYVSSLELNRLDRTDYVSNSLRVNDRTNDMMNSIRLGLNQIGGDQLHHSSLPASHNSEERDAQNQALKTSQSSEMIFRKRNISDNNDGKEIDKKDFAQEDSYQNALVNTGRDPDYPEIEEQPNDNSNNKKSFMVVAYQRIVRSISMFFDHVLYTPHPISSDVYTWMFICDFINFIILIYGFWAFGAGYTNESVTSFLNENKIPSSVLVMLFVQFASIMIDRYLYLKKNIKIKLFYHVFLVIAIHIWLFFLLPTFTGRTLTFKQNWPPKLFYIFKCIYFLLSAYQIRCGYPRRVLGYCFTKGFGYANLAAIKIYRAIPLLYDLRIYMDWIWTETTLEYRNWYIMEDMFSNLFIRKCELIIEDEYPTLRAKPQSHYSKYLYGGFYIILILSIIWGPLLLFSMGKTVGESNPPLEFEYQLEIVGYEPIFKVRASTSQIFNIDESHYDQLKSAAPPACQNFFADYKTNDVKVISLDTDSSSLWAISRPSLTQLKERLNPEHAERNEEIILKSTYELYRKKKQKANSLDSITGVLQSPFDNSTFKYLKAKIENNFTEPITSPPVFPNFIRVPEVGSISLVDCLSQGNINSTRRLNLTYDSSGVLPYWNAGNAYNSSTDGPYKFWNDLGFIINNRNNSLVIVAFNDRIFTGILALLSAPGIIGLYTTFVIFVARIIRNEPSGKVIYTELPKVDRVYGLVMDIYMMRESGEFELEEKLFAKLLFLYRCPELLIEWSKREDEHDALMSPS